MDRIRILVVSTDGSVALFLNEHLPAGSFEVRSTPPGGEMLAASDHQAVDVALIDRIDQHPEAAQLAVRLLKGGHPQVQIIAISRHSSQRDAPVVEQGLFYYWTGSLRPGLAQLVQAAAAAGAGKGGPAMT